MRLAAIALFLLTLLFTPAYAAATVSPEVEGFLSGTISLRNAVIPTVLLVTLLSIAPGLLMMVTCFPFIAIIFSFLRQALGLQSAPPTMMLTSLALFLTFFIMEPVFTDVWTDALQPLLDGEITELEAAPLAAEPLQDFMAGRVKEDTLFRLANAVGRPAESVETAPLTVLVPSFMLSEITRAFQLGFAIFLPFLVIDLVVASVLMAMGMMMVPPAVVALPFKLAFFVLADGWVAMTEALLRGYA
ncbi:flagellar type III secretion system pore protein FliP [Parvularcula sp. ZS-1/3]|uniref:Flagellar biosynthetic protein FliP n=1 Tax=Parvularcula mediterranea TaxID=2732508 RepID=A0A7Y3RNG5_9PROT|nr:flagellar type III secretion system pore protein FliP [Parvularcula mediterranea]NNU17298.1 flagellar type III secretion system pore protein FliP [Parvularcula mediterranea]